MIRAVTALLLLLSLNARAGDRVAVLALIEGGSQPVNQWADAVRAALPGLSLSVADSAALRSLTRLDEHAAAVVRSHGVRRLICIDLQRQGKKETSIRIAERHPQTFEILAERTTPPFTDWTSPGLGQQAVSATLDVLERSWTAESPDVTGSRKFPTQTVSSSKRTRRPRNPSDLWWGVGGGFSAGFPIGNAEGNGLGFDLRAALEVARVRFDFDIIAQFSSFEWTAAELSVHYFYGRGATSTYAGIGLGYSKMAGEVQKFIGEQETTRSNASGVGLSAIAGISMLRESDHRLLLEARIHLPTYGDTTVADFGPVIALQLLYLY